MEIFIFILAITNLVIVSENIGLQLILPILTLLSLLVTNSGSADNVGVIVFVFAKTINILIIIINMLYIINIDNNTKKILALLLPVVIIVANIVNLIK